ncbi:MAG: hypothetical protein ACO3GU_04300, partial [Pelagibacteraceae bacterium]
QRKKEEVNKLRTELEAKIEQNGLNKTNILQKFNAGNRNVNKLISNAKKLKVEEAAQVAAGKQADFNAFLNTLTSLTAEDKEALRSNGKMNQNAARTLAEKRQKYATKKQLSNFLNKNVVIQNADKNALIKLFNNGEMNINAIQKKALEISEQRKVENLRKNLETKIERNGLNKTNLLKKFNNGNRNVNRLIMNAKKQKEDEAAQVIEQQKQVQAEFNRFLNKLPGLTNEDKSNLRSNGKMNQNAARTLSEKRVIEQKKSEKNAFQKFLENIQLSPEDQNTMMTNYNKNTLTINALQKRAQELKKSRLDEQKIVNKEELLKYMKNTKLSNDVKAEIEKKFNSNQGSLKNLQLNINKMVKNMKNMELKKNKNNFANFIQTTPLTQVNKNGYIRRLSLNNVNIPVLKAEVNARLAEMVATQREKNRDELEQYMVSKELSNENKKVILNKFDINNKLSVQNIQTEVNAIVQNRIEKQLTIDATTLSTYVNKLGLNQEVKNSLVQKLNKESLENLMSEADAIHKKIINAKVKADMNALNKYMTNKQLSNNNKGNIISKKLSFNDSIKLANNMFQQKIALKRETNRQKLNLHLGNLSLTNEEKQPFYNNFNKNVNLNTVIKNASTYASKKIKNAKNAERKELVNFLTQQGFNNSEQKEYINRLNKNTDKLNTLKNEAKGVMNNKFKKLKATKRQQLIKELNKLELNTSDKEKIIKNFDNTNVNANTLMQRAQEINKARKTEKFVQDEGDFMNFLNTLTNLTPENKVQITSKLDGYFTNWDALKQNATNKAINRASEKRSKQKSELKNYINSLGIKNSDVERKLLKNFDDGVQTISQLKNAASTYKKQLNANAFAEKKKQLSNFLKPLIMNANDKAEYIKEFNTGNKELNTLKQNALKKQEKTIQERRDSLSSFLTNLGLKPDEQSLILSNFDADPRTNMTLRNKGKELKAAMNAAKREQLMKELREYLNTLNLLNDQNKQSVLSMNIKSLNNGISKADELQLSKKIAKKQQNRVVFLNAIKNLTPEDQADLTKKFNSQNVVLANMMKEANNIRKVYATAKRASNRAVLYNTINKLNMDVTNRNSIMNKFNKSNVGVNALVNEARQLKSASMAKKRATNRDSLVELLKKLNLSELNRNQIIKTFNANQTTTLVSLGTTAEELVKQRKVEKRLANRLE